jgi:hypothetical protein
MKPEIGFSRLIWGAKEGLFRHWVRDSITSSLFLLFGKCLWWEDNSRIDQGESWKISRDHHYHQDGHHHEEWTDEITFLSFIVGTNDMERQRGRNSLHRQESSWENGRKWVRDLMNLCVSFQFHGEGNWSLRPHAVKLMFTFSVNFHPLCVCNNRFSSTWCVFHLFLTLESISEYKSRLITSDTLTHTTHTRCSTILGVEVSRWESISILPRQDVNYDYRLHRRRRFKNEEKGWQVSIQETRIIGRHVRQGQESHIGDWSTAE